jgi:hypothetical protein
MDVQSRLEEKPIENSEGSGKMIKKAAIVAFSVALSLTALPSAGNAQGTSPEEQRERCFVVMLSAWCPGISSSTGADTKKCVKKHWSEMGPYCQAAYRSFKP